MIFLDKYPDGLSETKSLKDIAVNECILEELKEL